ncbi:hypothetical protein GGF43_001019 [Coemansia sp. RSA 2618]|nr:hypothetical protein GGF43_001019 [Coemansia sp. RSA 2618]
MCSNTQCTWPFDSHDMHTHFMHDSTVPSIRKRAKRRKHSTREPQQQQQPRAKKLKDAAAENDKDEGGASSSLVGDIEWLTQLCESTGQGNCQPMQWLDPGVRPVLPDVVGGGLSACSPSVVADHLFQSGRPDDAVIPQHSRQPSPQSEHDELGDLALLMGGKHAFYDPLEALLSPPVSAAPEKQHSELSMLDPSFWDSQLKVSSKQGFDLDALLKGAGGPPAFVSEDVSPLDTESLVENLFGAKGAANVI